VLSVLCCTAVASASNVGTGMTARTGTAGLKAAATAWSHAFLTGTVADILSMEGTQCRSGPTVSPKIKEEYLKGMRATMQKYIGHRLSSIRITGIRTRNVTPNTGDAEVEYALPARAVGNDNWVSYGYQGGRWKVTSCHAPIGGEDSSAKSSATAPD
jgi:hypothetical protein